MYRRFDPGQAGVSLVELMIVVMISVVVMGAGFMFYTHAQQVMALDEARASAAQERDILFRDIYKRYMAQGAAPTNTCTPTACTYTIVEAATSAHPGTMTYQTICEAVPATLANVDFSAVKLGCPPANGVACAKGLRPVIIATWKPTVGSQLVERYPHFDQGKKSGGVSSSAIAAGMCEVSTAGPPASTTFSLYFAILGPKPKVPNGTLTRAAMAPIINQRTMTIQSVVCGGCKDNR